MKESTTRSWFDSKTSKVAVAVWSVWVGATCDVSYHVSLYLFSPSYDEVGSSRVHQAARQSDRVGGDHFSYDVVCDDGAEQMQVVALAEPVAMESRVKFIVEWFRFAVRESLRHKSAD